MSRTFPKIVAALTVALAVFSPITPLSAQDASDTQVRIGAYNLENAFDVFDDPYTDDEGSDVKQRAELEAIAAGLKELDADVVGLVELENLGLLRAVLHDYLPDAGYDYVAVQPTNSGRGINIGLISRLPIISVTSYRWQDLESPDYDQSLRFARDLFHAKLEAPDGSDEPLHMFVVHFKSKSSRQGDPQSINYRSAEARKTKQIIGEIVRDNPEARVALVGDFNTDLGDPANDIVFGPYDGGEPVLIDTQEEIGAREDRITLPGTRYPDAIFDYIAASPALAETMVEGSATVISDPQLTSGSDHYPVATTFDFATPR